MEAFPIVVILAKAGIYFCNGTGFRRCDKPV
jgi:hypothetical protein